MRIESHKPFLSGNLQRLKLINPLIPVINESQIIGLFFNIENLHIVYTQLLGHARMKSVLSCASRHGKTKARSLLNLASKLLVKYECSDNS